MKRGHAFPSKYLGRVDVEDSPLVCTIAKVTIERLEGEHGSDDKPVVSFSDQSKDLILNGTNWDSIEEIATTGGVTDPGDSDCWTGLQVVLYFDPNVRFGKRITGGVRVRPTEGHGQPATGSKQYDEANPPPAGDDDHPF